MSYEIEVACEQTADQETEALLVPGNNLEIDEISEIVSSYNEGLYQTVINKASKLLDTFPNNSVLWRLLGTAQSALECHDEAEGSFRRATELMPHDVGLLNALGNSLAAQSKLEEALTVFDLCVKQDENFAHGYFNKGRIEKALGNNLEAAHYFKQAIEKNKDYEIAAHELSTISLEHRLHTHAEIAHELLVRHDPTNPLHCNNYGASLLANGKYELAQKFFFRAILFKTDFCEAYNNLAICFFSTEMFAEALDAVSKSISINPSYAKAHVTLGDILMADGDTVASKNAFETAAQLDPGLTKLISTKASMGA